jgi:hypothetical protein
VASIQLEDVVWLGIDFAAFIERPDRLIPGEDPAAESEDHADQPEPVAAELERAPQPGETSEPITYVGRIEPDDEDEDAVVLFITVEINDPETPFRLKAQLGARFRFPEADAHPEGQVRSTLMWMAYPYVRELVATVTSRSPHETYFMPPMTRMPDPAAVQGAEPLAEPPAAGADAG